jgi:hypothetical protein
VGYDSSSEQEAQRDDLNGKFCAVLTLFFVLRCKDCIFSKITSIQSASNIRCCDKIVSGVSRWTDLRKQLIERESFAHILKSILSVLYDRNEPVSRRHNQAEKERWELGSSMRPKKG